ncbi:hypothetical protein BXZ70DRAFT_1063486 [Cristinia sonorae]|uniref:Uncharacterized protein n=1 Tax=Cristinia sonorae TaxID=1940300 RepID=A0A8K0UUD6_9AGAR|nr:hypothetical protein BXZ70DRAFT_1063486 [Cristinia sonorae]
MYAPAVLAVALALSTPALSAPVHVTLGPNGGLILAARDNAVVDQSGASIFTTIFKALPSVISGIGSLFGGNSQQKRELEDIFMRELLFARDDVESGASIFSTLFKAIPTVVSGIQSIFGGNNQQKRDLEELVMRELNVARDDVESGASIFSTIVKAIPSVISGISSIFGGNSEQKRDVEELLMREVLAARDDVESGASIFSVITKALPTIVSGISSLFGGNNQQRREVEELVARSLFNLKLTPGAVKFNPTLFPLTARDDAESGASIFTSILKAVPTIVSGIHSIFGGDDQQKREIEELVMRDVLNARALGKFPILSVLPSVLHPVGIADLQKKREVEHLVMREIFARAAEDDASGASIFSTIFKALPTVINGIGSLFGGNNQQKREVEHLIMREVLERAVDAEQSGASIFSTIFKALPTVINGITSIFGGNNNNQREVAELLARSFLDEAMVARSLNELD